MRIPFNGNYGISQKFNDPCCRASYAQFGMKGHNGIDYALPSGTQVVAAESGTARNLSDPGGFGNYVEITGAHKTIYAHLKSFSVGNGAKVSEGQVVGISGATGNVTGAHLHFGVKPIPADNNNGFLGAIDPQPIINGGSQGDEVTDLFTCRRIAYSVWGINGIYTKENALNGDIDETFKKDPAWLGADTNVCLQTRFDAPEGQKYRAWAEKQATDGGQFELITEPVYKEKK